MPQPPPTAAGKRKKKGSHNSYLRILEVTAEAIQRNDVSLENSDECLEAVIAAHKRELPEEDVAFIQHLFDGCITFHRVLKKIAMRVCAENNIRRRESPLYIVLLYLCVCELDNLAANTFERFMLSLSPPRITPVLRTIFDKDALESGWLRDVFVSCYEDEVAQSQFIQPMLMHADEVNSLADSMEDPVSLSELQQTVSGNKRVDAGSNSPPLSMRGSIARGNAATLLRATVPKPFNLTQPKPRKVEIPEEPPRIEVFKTNPVPPSTYETPLEVEALERKKRANQRRAEKLAMEAEAEAFNCAPTGAAIMNQHRARAEQRSAAARRLQNQLPQARALPKSLYKKVRVKLNSAAILREEQQYRKQLEQEAERLKRLEEGAFNEEELKEIELDLKREEEEQRLADLERRVLEGQISREEALIARQAALEQRIETAQTLKQEHQQLLDRARRVQEKRGEERRKKAEEIIQDRANVALAVERVQEHKSELRNRVIEESQELKERRAQEEAEERERKLAIIREIQALESVKTDRSAEFDPTEAPDHGILAAMSFAELQQRLDLRRRIAQQEEDMKREAIFEAKLARDVMMKEKVAAIQRGRAQLGHDRTMKRLNKPATTSSLAAASATRSRIQTAAKKDPKVDELRRKLAAKRAERMRGASNMASRASSVTSTATATAASRAVKARQRL